MKAFNSLHSVLICEIKGLQTIKVLRQLFNQSRRDIN